MNLCISCMPYQLWLGHVLSVASFRAHTLKQLVVYLCMDVLLSTRAVLWISVSVWHYSSMPLFCHQSTRLLTRVQVRSLWFSKPSSWCFASQVYEFPSGFPHHWRLHVSRLWLEFPWSSMHSLWDHLLSKPMFRKLNSEAHTFIYKALVNTPIEHTLVFTML